MKKTILIVLVLAFNLASCQKKKKEQMIEQFITNLFNKEIPPDKLIAEYLEIKSDSSNTFSLKQRKELAKGVIKETRENKGIDGSWLIPNNKIKALNNLKVYPYEEYEKLSKLKINGIDSIKKNVYVLMDSEKKKILQYILLNDSNEKIISFSLFVKSDLGFFFVY